ncbi:cytochrome-c peroxidase [Limnovirga soli]|uniref:Cytochrome-c peroxidase n=1 Tax=Limnovirga soli TaxID=2656915 RepID=A0A8J8FA08_9BACT|nr:cytochrome c peroxidase [Limnovirga soli]NNV54163.1 cytochrome-c peroxidase [Limnovirga soli]
MQKRLIYICYLLCYVLLMSACDKSSDKPAIGVLLPVNFPEPVYNLAANPVSWDGFQLGKSLFYDPILSKDNSVSCGSCHIATSAFTQHGHTVSHGINDQLGKRNSLSLVNLAWGKDFFWDGGVHNFDLVAFNPIQNPVEMDETVANVIVKLQQISAYKQQFKAAFGSEEITTQTFTKALSQFMLCMVSANSKYDQYVRKENNITLTTDELDGLALVKAKCSNCHATDLFTDGSFRNNGLSSSFEKDMGRYNVTLMPEDMGKFKVPTLRNLTYSTPYMHDGRFTTLEQVLNHYSSGVKATATLDSTLLNNGTTGIALSDGEKQHIIAFLKTLDDESFIRDKRFQEE